MVSESTFSKNKRKYSKTTTDFEDKLITSRREGGMGHRKS
jgi:hypothetical protein